MEISENSLNGDDLNGKFRANSREIEHHILQSRKIVNKYLLKFREDGSRYFDKLLSDRKMRQNKTWNTRRRSYSFGESSDDRKKVLKKKKITHRSASAPRKVRFYKTHTSPIPFGRRSLSRNRYKTPTQRELGNVSRILRISPKSSPTKNSFIVKEKIGIDIRPRTLGECRSCVGLDCVSVPTCFITSLKGVNALKDCRELYITNNYIRSFKYLLPLKNLEVLDLRKNSLCSCYGLCNLSKLKHIRIEDNPLMNNENHRMMLMIGAGKKSLKSINGKIVPREEKNKVDDYLARNPLASTAVKLGWIMETTEDLPQREFEKIIHYLNRDDVDLDDREFLMSSPMHRKLFASDDEDFEKVREKRKFISRNRRKVSSSSSSSSIESGKKLSIENTPRNKELLNKIRDLITVAKRTNVLLKREEEDHKKTKLYMLKFEDLKGFETLIVKGFVFLFPSNSNFSPQGVELKVDIILHDTFFEIRFLQNGALVGIKYKDIKKKYFIKDACIVPAPVESKIYDGGVYEAYFRFHFDFVDGSCFELATTSKERGVKLFKTLKVLIESVKEDVLMEETQEFKEIETRIEWALKSDPVISNISGDGENDFGEMIPMKIDDEEINGLEKDLKILLEQEEKLRKKIEDKRKFFSGKIREKYQTSSKYRNEAIQRRREEITKLDKRRTALEIEILKSETQLRKEEEEIRSLPLDIGGNVFEDFAIEKIEEKKGK